MKYDFDQQVAKDVWVEEAILLSNIQWWSAKNQADRSEAHFHEWEYWTYNSARAWAELFPFWDARRVYRLLDRLEAKWYLKSWVFNKLWFDRTKWYRPLVKYGECSCQKWEIHLPKVVNAVAKSGQPIPDIKPQIKTSDKKTISFWTVEKIEMTEKWVVATASRDTLQLKHFQEAKDTLDFNVFYTEYPIKKWKWQAIKAYKTALKKTTADIILDGAQKYRQWLESKGEKKYIKHPATWLNWECWNDELEPVQTNRPKNALTHKPLDDEDPYKLYKTDMGNWTCRMLTKSQIKELWLEQ